MTSPSLQSQVVELGFELSEGRGRRGLRGPPASSAGVNEHPRGRLGTSGTHFAGEAVRPLSSHHVAVALTNVTLSSSYRLRRLENLGYIGYSFLMFVYF